MNIGGNAGIVDGGSADKVGSLIARAAVGIDDYGALTREILQQSGTDGLHDRADGRGVIVGRHTNEDVRLADVNQLAKKLISQNAFLGHLLPLLSLPSVQKISSRISVHGSQILRRRNQ